MNNRSFMRSIDPSKLIQVEAATIQFVVKHGYGGASVSAIAEEAGVSKGYLYRFYKNKQELVQTLLKRHIDVLINKISSLLEEGLPTDKVVKLIVEYVFDTASEFPDQLKFVHVLMHDYNFQVGQSQRNKIKQVCELFYNIGVKNKTVSTDRTIEEIFFIGVLYPIEFINIRFKEFFDKGLWTDRDKNNVINFCITTLNQ